MESKETKKSGKKILAIVLIVTLSVLLLLSLAAAGGLGWYSWHLHSQLEEANAELESANAKFDIECDADSIEDIEMLKEEGKPLIVVFGADYCPTCVSYKPYVREIARLYGDEITVKFVDTVAHEDIRYDYNIEFIPSTIFFNADGSIFTPDENIEVYESEEHVDDPIYVSEVTKIVPGSAFGANDFFEYGVFSTDIILDYEMPDPDATSIDAEPGVIHKEFKAGSPAYCKYVGYLEIQQLAAIAEALI